MTDLTCLTRFFRVAAGGEPDAMGCNAQRPFCWRIRRKCDVIYREIVRSRRRAVPVEAPEQTAKRKRFVRRAARGFVARSKNHSRILPLTFLRFARPRRGNECVYVSRACVCVCIDVCLHEERVTWTACCPPQPPMAFHRPILFADMLARCAHVCCALKDQFFEVTDSHWYPGAGPSAAPAFPRGVPRDSARAAARYHVRTLIKTAPTVDADCPRYNICVSKRWKLLDIRYWQQSASRSFICNSCQ